MHITGINISQGSTHGLWRFVLGQYCLPLGELLNPRRLSLEEESLTVGSYGRSRGCSDSRCPDTPLPQPSPPRQPRLLCREGSCVATGTKAPVAQGGGVIHASAGHASKYISQNMANALTSTTHVLKVVGK